MATKAQDTFTEASDTALGSHTPDTGTGWTVTSDDGSDGITVVAADDNIRNDVTMASNRYTLGKEDTDIGDDDMDVSITYAVASTDSFIQRSGACGRILDKDNMYYGGQRTTTAGQPAKKNRTTLEKIVSNAFTELGSDNTDVVNGDTIKLEIRTAAKKLYQNGTERISSTDDVLTGNNFAGVFFERNSFGAGVRFDDFLSEDTGAPPPPSGPPVGSLALLGVGR